MFKYANDHLVQRFEDWWRRDNHGLPLMRVVARRDVAVTPPAPPQDLMRKYTDADYLLAYQRAYDASHEYLADSFAALSADLGPGSLALYLGAEPRFAPSTVWYEPCISDIENQPPLKFDPENHWWKLHLALIKKLRAAAGEDFRINIPDLIENIDIYAAMRGPQDALYDIMDYPERVEELIRQIDDTYFEYYDALCDIVRDSEGVTSYTAFSILGRGRVAKIQCDFSAMMSPAQFRRFIQPALRRQTLRLDHSLYHLDGPDAIRHVPAIMELERLDALQWTCGAGQPDGACPRWYGIYDQVAAAGKGLWIQLYNGGVDGWIRGAESLMERYDKRMFYFNFPDMSQTDADKLMARALNHWM